MFAEAQMETLLLEGAPFPSRLELDNERSDASFPVHYWVSKDQQQCEFYYRQYSDSFVLRSDDKGWQQERYQYNGELSVR